MHISTLSDTDGSRCILTFEESQQWLRATWRGFIDSSEAMRGADNYLAQVAPLHCAYLLNDNTDLQGPWFDSVEWLERVWLPQALDLGLRYVAHVPQTSTHADILTLRFPEPLVGRLELQIFEQVSQAEDWLRSRQAADASSSGQEPAYWQKPTAYQAAGTSRAGSSDWAGTSSR